MYVIASPNCPIARWGNESVFFPDLFDSKQAVSINPQNGAIISGTGKAYNGLALLGKSWDDHPYRNRIPDIVGDLNKFNSLYVGLPKGIWANRKKQLRSPASASRTTLAEIARRRFAAV